MALDPVSSPAASLAAATTRLTAPATSTVRRVDSRAEVGGTYCYAEAWSRRWASVSYPASVSWLIRSHE
jgi:hypothetical protein